MLSISKMAAGQERYYLELGREDYYLEGGEPLGRWLGRGAEALGLSGNVQKEHLRAVMEGRSPRDEAPLGQLQEYGDGRKRQVGWDLTFSAPKTVSVLWSQASDELRAAIQNAHFEAVKAGLSYLEETAAVTRRGQGGSLLASAELVIATFEHGTSRAQDPQLHTHCLAMAAARRADGSWGQLHSEPLYEHKMAAGALYRLALAQGLRALGLELRAEKTWFEVANVPEEVAEHFSKRRAEIEALLSELGASGARASEKLALTSRQVKEHVARAELFPRWQSEGAAHGFGPDQAARIFQTPALAEAHLTPATIRAAVKELTDSDSTFSERDLVRRVAENVQAEAVAPSSLISEVRRFLASSEEVVSLAVGEGGRSIYTEASLYKAEGDVLDLAQRLRSRDSHAVPEGVVSKLFSSLNEEQRGALLHITSAGDLKLLSGMAGTGKTYLLDAARMAWEKSGYRVLGAALSGRAAHELEDGAGIKSSTIESLLYRLEPTLKRTLTHHARMLLREAAGRGTWKLPRLVLDKKTVLVLDESSMIGTRHLARILRAAERAGTKVVLAGDPGQLQSIAAGGGFGGLLKRFGGATLTNIVRQEQSWMRLAVHQFSEGDARSALANYALADRLHIEGTRDEAMRALLLAWKHERTAKPSETLILAATNREVDELNRRAQAMRAGELGAGITHEGQTFHEGDRVIFKTTWRPLGVLNGDFGTVETVKGGRLCVLLDRQRATEAGPHGIRVIVSKKDLTVNAFGEERDLMRLGFASTVHAAQGATVDRAFVLAGGWMEDREMAYVAMSRAREHARIFTDEAAAGEDLAELARSMARSHQKLLAHDHQQRLSQSP